MAAVARHRGAGAGRRQAAEAALPGRSREAEIKPLAGTWFNAEEPSLFDLAWRNGEATVTQNGLPFALGRRADGWLAAERGSFEFALKPGRQPTLQVDLGAGRVLTFKKLGRRKAVPAAIAGTYVSADSGATWEIRRGGEDWMADVGGPLIAGGPAWPVRGIDADTVEIDIARQLDHGDPARPSGARPRRPVIGARSLDRPHQEDAVRAAGLVDRRASRPAIFCSTTRWHERAWRPAVQKISGTESRTSGRRWSTAHSGRARA